MANIFTRFFKSEKQQTKAPNRIFQSTSDMDARSFSYANATSIDATIGYDLSNPYIDKYGTGEYIKYGADNLYPQHLIDMYYGSAFHSSIIKFLSDIIMSSEVIISLPTSTLEDELTLTKLKRKISADFIRRVTQEYLIHNRNDFYVHKEGKRVKSVDIVGADQVRKASQSKGYYVSEDWSNRRYKEEYVPNYDMYRDADENAKELLEIASLGPGNCVYPLPQYVAASNWIWLDYQVAYFQKQNIENSLNPSAIIKIYKTFAGKEDKEKYIRSLTSSFAGARNAGKAIVLQSKDRDTAPDIQMMDANKLDEAFQDVQESIVNNIAYAHQISPVVMGVATAGKLGATSEILDAYQILANTKLKALSMNIEGILDQVAKLYDKNAEVKINLSTEFVDALKNNADGTNTAVQQMINEIKKQK